MSTGLKRQTRPVDVIGAIAKAMWYASGEKAENVPNPADTGGNLAAATIGRKARPKAMVSERITEIVRPAAWARYGKHA